MAKRLVTDDVQKADTEVDCGNGFPILIELIRKLIDLGSIQRLLVPLPAKSGHDLRKSHLAGEYVVRGFEHVSNAFGTSLEYITLDDCACVEIQERQSRTSLSSSDSGRPGR